MDDPLPIETGADAAGTPPRTRVRPTAGFVPFGRDEIEHPISTRFERIASEHPGRLAVRGRNHMFTYEELNRFANRVARDLLSARGPGPEPIALLMERDAPQVGAILGVVKAGKFYVPLSPSHPKARNELILADSEARLIIADGENRDEARHLAVSRADILDLDGLDHDPDGTDLGLDIPASSLAYIIYTSGTTGRPKGIVETHRNVLHNIRNNTGIQYLCCDDRIATLNAFAFSGSLKDLFGALLNGAALIPMEVEHEGFRGLARRIADDGITVFSSVSTAFRHFATDLTERDEFPALRIIRIGSEEVTPKDVELFRRHFPRSCVLINGYGGTETGTVRLNVIDHDSPIDGGVVPIGYPVEGVETLLLDDSGKPLGPGVVGRIAVRGRYLSPGYWRRPDLTGAAFLPDPSGGDERTYLTGDLGRLRPDGCLIHAGREDFQVKVRGNRVEVAEVESVLRQVPWVDEAVVVARADLPENQRLVAYVVPRGGKQSAPPGPSSRLRGFLRERIPDFAVPSAFVVLDALPLGPTGKTDRSALPAPDRGRSTLSAAFSAPTGELETEMARIWEDVMGVRPIGVDDNFFELGGNSLLAVRIASRVRETFGSALPLETLVMAPTIGRMAKALGDESGTTAQPLVIALRAVGSKPPLFCLPGSGGHVFSYYNLARLGDPEQPFFGLQFPEPGRGRPIPTRIEDMAAQFLDEIRKIQPEGPYHLGGYSFGGTVAYELAQQLFAEGEQVALLVLFDTWAKGFPRVRPWVLRLPTHLKRMARLGPAGIQSYLVGRVRNRVGRIVGSVVPDTHGEARAANEAGMVENLSEINHRAFLDYEPQPYPSRLVLFRAGTRPDWLDSCIDDPTLGWGVLAARGLEIRPVPGAHLTLFDEPNVGALADELKSCLP